MNNHIIYQVRVGTQWVTAKTAREVQRRCLNYTLSDGTVGLARPKMWKKLAKDFYAK
jgi:hypothetical protein